LAAFSSHSRLDLSTKMTSLDYVCLSPHKNLGGSESTGVLIGKKSAYKSENPSFPGGGTVVVCIILIIFKIYKNKIEEGRDKREKYIIFLKNNNKLIF